MAACYITGAFGWDPENISQASASLCVILVAWANLVIPESQFPHPSREALGGRGRGIARASRLGVCTGGGAVLRGKMCPGHLTTSGVADFVPPQKKTGVGRVWAEERGGGGSRGKGPGSAAEVLWVLVELRPQQLSSNRLAMLGVGQQDAGE